MYSISEIVGSAPWNIHSLFYRETRKKEIEIEKTRKIDREKEGGARERMTTRRQGI